MKYIRLPNSKFDIRISNTGEIKSFDENQKTPNTYLNHKGYVCSWYVGSNGKNLTFRVHRMVGELFITPPHHLAEIPIKELQINHKDTNKMNNDVSNLEWVTNAENMKHARDNGCFNNEKAVLVKNSNGEIVSFKSLSEVCRNKNIKPTDLSIHLNQLTAGCVVFNGERYKFDNGQPWCEVNLYPGVEHKFSYQYKLKVINQITGDIWLSRSLPEICKLLGLNINIIKNTAQRTGVMECKNKIWRFEYIDNNNQKNKQIPIIRLDRVTGEIKEYSSSRVCAKENNIDHSKLFKHISTYMAGMLPWNGYYFKYKDGLDFPNVDYLIPNANVIGRTIRWLVYSVETNRFYPLTSLSDFCEYFNYKPCDVYHHLERASAGIPFNGFIFTDITNLTMRDIVSILRNN